MPRVIHSRVYRVLLPVRGVACKLKGIRRRMGMDSRLCPSCSWRSEVIDCRPTATAVRRRRMCRHCGQRWTTWESSLDSANVRVVAESFALVRQSLRDLLEVCDRMALNNAPLTSGEDRRDAANGCYEI